MSLDTLGYVLAGGESSRMQRADLPRDKALLMLGGQSLLQRALNTVWAVCSEPRILCGSQDRCERLRHLGPTVTDQADGYGPLAGLHAALHDAASRGATWVLVTPVDLPLMSAAVLRRFVKNAKASAAGAACMRAEGILQPLPVVLRTEAEPLLAHALRVGDRKLMPVLRGVAETCGNRSSLCVVDAVDVAPEWNGEGLFRNLNTPDDFEAAQQDVTFAGVVHQSKHGG